MALANVAAELAQRGRRVLAVDFDLEAPGLDTFDLTPAEGSVPGIVDFVGEYLATGQAPAVDKFIFESPGVGADGGALWFMPSGAHNDNYANSLAGIDWGELYQRHDGYLLFEDLKEQWKDCIRPDYVLIDSRAGHTDVGGICTRQLPDSVAILFFPNLQNFRGLTKVVQDIRAEADVLGKKPIHLHFILSNVPDLDDEDGILGGIIHSFEEGLGFDDPLIIHRYDSLALLNQEVFTKTRPSSRLAKEYHSVVKEIMRHNPLDRDGALDFLQNVDLLGGLPRSRENWQLQQRKIAEHLKIVQENYQNDGEILFRLGCIPDRLGRLKAAAKRFDRSIEAGYHTPEVFLRRAQIRNVEFEDTKGAHEDAVNVINHLQASTDQVLQALNSIGTDNLESVRNMSGLLSRPPHDRIWIAKEFNTTRAEAKFALNILRPLQTESGLSADLVDAASEALVLQSIAVGRFADAIEAIQRQESDLQAMSIAQAFNYGMALWGETGQIVREPFEPVLNLELPRPDERPTPNMMQCIAVAFWAVGRIQDAKQAATSAILFSSSRNEQEFSCWRYLQVPSDQFERDVNELQKLIDGDKSVKPLFRSLSEQAASLGIRT